jgi:hypothetical protein
LEKTNCTRLALDLGKQSSRSKGKIKSSSESFGQPTGIFGSLQGQFASLPVELEKIIKNELRTRHKTRRPLASGHNRSPPREPLARAQSHLKSPRASANFQKIRLICASERPTPCIT